MAAEVTLDDVARKSGVSRATASRALNGRSGVKPDVRERVRLVAKAIGYRPNRAAKNLAGGRTSVIGLVIGHEELVADPYAMHLVQEVARAADANDEGLMLLADSKAPNEAVQNLLADGLVDGVIITAVAVGERWVEELIDATMPTVLVGAHPRRSDLPLIDVENRRSTADLVQHLFDTGCRRVGTITGPLDRVDAVRRLEGYRLAHEERSIPVDESLIVEGDFSRQVGHQAAEPLFDAGVDAICCANDETALGVLYRANELGVDVPGQVSLTGFDGTTTPTVGTPSITSARQPFAELAERAVLLLIDRIEGVGEPREELLTPTLIYGDSTRPPPESDPETG
ncbi:MAG: LacI family DNA-binding transcriptional regulator [Actinomycetota bacterium]